MLGSGPGTEPALGVRRFGPETSVNLNLSMNHENSTQDAFLELLQVVIFALCWNLEE